MAGNRESIIDKVSAFSERVAAGQGLEIVQVELAGSGRNRVLRVFIDRPPAEGKTVPLDQPSGATLDDCETVSHLLSEVLDAEDVIPGDGYKLEVSTPGVERKLLRLKDYERFFDHPAKIVLKEPAEGMTLIQGVLKGVEGNLILVEVAGGKRVTFPIEQVSKASLKFRW